MRVDDVTCGSAAGARSAAGCAHASLFLGAVRTRTSFPRVLFFSQILAKFRALSVGRRFPL